MTRKDRHPRFAALDALWVFPEEVINQVMWYFTYDEDEPDGCSLDWANKYLEHMDGQGYETPAEAWPEWCDDNPGEDFNEFENPFED